MYALHGKNIIGASLSSEGKRTFQAKNPADNELLPVSFVEASEGEINLALSLAAEAFQTYRERTSEERAVFLEKIAEEILAYETALLELAHRETGLPMARLESERGRTISQIRLFADLIRNDLWRSIRKDEAIPERQPNPKPDIRRTVIPLGPVVVFGASNFPLAFSVAGGDTISALAAGNPVVCKGHPAHPGSSEMVAEAIRRAVAACGLPEGVFSMVHGASHAVGMFLVNHPQAKAVAFTGSLAGGRALFDAAARRPEPIPVYAEMGSINPIFLLPGALEERQAAIAQGLHHSITFSVGQLCTKPGLIVAMESPALSALLEDLRARIRETQCGTMLHSGICEAYTERVQMLKKTPGVELLAESGSPADPGKTQGAAAAFSTSAKNFLERTDLSDEVFGPSTLVVRCTDRRELQAVAAVLKGSLSVCVHATEAEIVAYRDLISVLETKTGRMVMNGYPTGLEVCGSIQHGGPYPATTDSRTTSVGTAAIERFVRPICYQNFIETVLPEELQNC